MENLEMKLFGDVYKNKRVMLTGHTGFKGSWLALWLQKLGAEVSGVALAPESGPNHWDLLNLSVDQRFVDIRDAIEINRFVESRQPEVVFHLAAQPLVRRSYQDPLETWSTNVMGTANVLNACRFTNSVQAIVVITTDKCYENQNWEWGYREIDALGGHDPYSASKAGAEIVAASFRKSFFETETSALVATARAGNVIGGGDWSEDRLIPDLVRSVESGNSVEIRSPQATRPWQHVLDPLSGYLLLGQKLLEGSSKFAAPWNFGPGKDGNQTVSGVLESARKYLPEASWHIGDRTYPHEAGLLHLDSSKASEQLEWNPVWKFDRVIQETANWYRVWIEHNRVESSEQVSRFVDSAKSSNAAWVD